MGVLNKAGLYQLNCFLQKFSMEDRSHLSVLMTKAKIKTKQNQKKNREEFLEVIYKLSTLIVVMLSWVYAYIQTHQNAHLKCTFYISAIPQQCLRNQNGQQAYEKNKINPFGDGLYYPSSTMRNDLFTFFSQAGLTLLRTQSIFPPPIRAEVTKL